ncbi:hypothetical protein K2173_026905 [Erythroxylum novogranatense]|uniref:Uncharacterized protein n=1 Tax=Erythroxylum novogranatense TaxID=1862640 RepID=A0AAV8U028_9ROSI|nr:hypothetical protein K2173_026905 [Erythroxylum novogranatense]
MGKLQKIQLISLPAEKAYSNLIGQVTDIKDREGKQKQGREGRYQKRSKSSAGERASTKVHFPSEASYIYEPAVVNAVHFDCLLDDSLLLMGICEWLLELVCIHDTDGDDDGGLTNAVQGPDNFGSCVMTKEWEWLYLGKT